MIDLSTITLFKRSPRRHSSLLALSLDGGRLDGVVLRRTNGSLQLKQSFSTALSLDPLTADVELVGREIRNHLDAAEVRERTCVVCVPLKWALTVHSELPPLAESDIPGFLEIEAERGFPCDVQTLHYATSRCRSASGKERVTLVGVPRSHVDLLERVLSAAKLKPISFALGITALQRPSAKSSDGVLALAIGENNVALQITGGGGIAALRTLEGMLETEGSRRVLHADLVAREARITLGQLPVELRDHVRRVRIFGPRDLAQQLADEMDLRLEHMSLAVEVVKNYSPDEFGVQLPADTIASAPFSLATEHLAGEGAPLEFLPPKVPVWQQVASKYSSGRFGLAGVAAAALLVIVGSAFAFQQWQMSRLQSQWNGMEKQVVEVEALQNKVRQFRPWNDDSFRGLTILRQLTTAFPEDGAVSAKMLEIRDLNTVTCSGVARDNRALMIMLKRLRESEGVSDFKTVQIRGQPPQQQFTFDFHWNEGGHHEN